MDNSIQPTNSNVTPPSTTPLTMSNINAKPEANPAFNPNSTQNSLQIAELRDGIVILKDGSFRSVIACESINFDLMSGTEREGIEFSYQGFLNSLFFPIQILVRSKKVDIGPYIDKLLKIRSTQDNMLLNVLMDDYINYIDALAQNANIMDKSFHVVVPYFPTGDIESAKNQAKNLLNMSNKDAVTTVKVNRQSFEKAKEELQNRVSVVRSGLEQVGVRSKRLNTQELSQLYYHFYNPDTALREPLLDFGASNLYVSKADSTLINPNPGDTN